MLNQAQEYAERGWHIFPVKYREKAPATKHGVKDATTDSAQIRTWWGVPHSPPNIGLATGKSGLVVIDIDKRPSVGLLPSIPRTLASRTPSGGAHLFYLAPDWELKPTAGRLPGVGATPGIDLRAGESYVVLPPSKLVVGKYEWTDVGPPWDPYSNIAPCPPWLKPVPIAERPLPKLRSRDQADKYANGALNQVMRDVRQAPEGQRNETLNARAFSLREFIEAGTLDHDEVVEFLTIAALRAGLEENEIMATLGSALG